MLINFFRKLGEAGWDTEEQSVGHSAELKLSFRWIYKASEHNFFFEKLITFQYELLFALLRSEVSALKEINSSVHHTRLRTQKWTSSRLIFSHWLFSLQVRGKKRQRGWFHSSHVKLLGPSNIKSSPSPLPGDGCHIMNTASCIQHGLFLYLFCWCWWNWESSSLRGKLQVKIALDNPANYRLFFVSLILKFCSDMWNKTLPTLNQLDEQRGK